jgi:hypothetical protein
VLWRWGHIPHNAHYIIIFGLALYLWTLRRPLDWRLHALWTTVMRRSDTRSGELFSYVDLEVRVRRNHPLRPMQEIANAVLGDRIDAPRVNLCPRIGN